MEYRVDAFRTEAAPVEEPRTSAGGRPARRARSPAIGRGIGLALALPLHLAAMALWWPIARALRAAGVDRTWLERVSRTLAE